MLAMFVWCVAHDQPVRSYFYFHIDYSIELKVAYPIDVCTFNAIASVYIESKCLAYSIFASWRVKAPVLVIPALS
jgi:hypothetical protein